LTADATDSPLVANELDQAQPLGTRSVDPALRNRLIEVQNDRVL